jgi:hypothetical protein
LLFGLVKAIIFALLAAEKTTFFKKGVRKMSYKIALKALCLFLPAVVLCSTLQTLAADENPAADVNNPDKAVSNFVIPDNNEVIASFGDSKLTMQQIKWLDPAVKTEPRIKYLAEQWLTNQIMYAEAKKRGLVDLPSVKFSAELAAMRAYGNQLKMKAIDSIEITDAEALAYYEKNKASSPMLGKPGMLSFTHIRTKTLEQANAAFERAKKGEDMLELARELSVDTDSPRGGVVRKYAYEVVEQCFGKEFLKAIMDANEGQFVGPVSIGGGFYEVARHEGHIAQKAYPFEEVKEQIKTNIKNFRAGRVVEELTESLKAQAADKVYKSPKIFSAEKTEDKKPDKK